MAQLLVTHQVIHDKKYYIACFSLPLDELTEMRLEWKQRKKNYVEGFYCFVFVRETSYTLLVSLLHRTQSELSLCLNG